MNGRKVLVFRITFKRAEEAGKRLHSLHDQDVTVRYDQWNWLFVDDLFDWVAVTLMLEMNIHT